MRLSELLTSWKSHDLASWWSELRQNLHSKTVPECEERNREKKERFYYPKVQKEGTNTAGAVMTERHARIHLLLVRFDPNQ